MWAAKALVRVHRSTGLFEPAIVAYVKTLNTYGLALLIWIGYSKIDGDLQGAFIFQFQL